MTDDQIHPESGRPFGTNFQGSKNGSSRPWEMRVSDPDSFLDDPGTPPVNWTSKGDDTAAIAHDLESTNVQSGASVTRLREAVKQVRIARDEMVDPDAKRQLEEIREAIDEIQEGLADPD